MCQTEPAIPYRDLVAIADRLFEESEEDDERLIVALDTIGAGARRELLISDLLNASQAFLYYFRTMPDQLVRERMELEPASALVQGLKIEEIDPADLIFVVKDDEPYILISDGDRIVASFTGKSAYNDAKSYISDHL